jgi:hypothetical protein
MRMARASVRAFNAATHINQEYLDIMKHGGAVMREHGTAQKVYKMLIDQARSELIKDPYKLEGMAVHLGLGLRDILSFPWWFSHHFTWWVNDMAYIERVIERQLEGLDRQAAIRETDRFIPNYRMPPVILGGSGDLVQWLRSSGAVIFMPYHYGVLKAWGQMAAPLLKDPLLRDPRVTHDKLESASKLALAGITLFALLPTADSIFQNITGDPRFRFRRAGLLTPAYDWERAVPEDTLTYVYAMESTFTPSPLSGIGIDLFAKQDYWTDPALSDKEKLTRMMQVAGAGAAPMGLRQVFGVGGATPDWQAAITSPIYQRPRHTPAESAMLTFEINLNARQSEINMIADTKGLRAAYQAAHGMYERMKRLVVQSLKDERVPEVEIPARYEAWRQKYHLRLPTLDAIQHRQELRNTPFSVAQETERRSRGTRGPRTYYREIP